MAAAEVGNDVRGGGANGGCEAFTFERELEVGAEAGKEGERRVLGIGGSSRAGGGRVGDGALFFFFFGC